MLGGEKGVENLRGLDFEVVEVAIVVMGLLLEKGIFLLHQMMVEVSGKKGILYEAK